MDHASSWSAEMVSSALMFHFFIVPIALHLLDITFTIIGGYTDILWIVLLASAVQTSFLGYAWYKNRSADPGLYDCDLRSDSHDLTYLQDGVLTHFSSTDMSSDFSESFFAFSRRLEISGSGSSRLFFPGALCT